MTQKRKLQTKFPFLILGGVLVVAAVVFCVLNLTQKPEQTNTVANEETPVAAEITEVTATTVATEGEEVVVEKEQVVKYEGKDPNTSETLFGTITRASVTNDKLTIRVSIDQFLSSGTCELSLTQNGATFYSETANIASDASTSTCEGFDVPTAKLKTGKNEIKIKLTAGDKVGTIEGEVEI